MEKRKENQKRNDYIYDNNRKYTYYNTIKYI